LNFSVSLVKASANLEWVFAIFNKILDTLIVQVNVLIAAADNATAAFPAPAVSGKIAKCTRASTAIYFKKLFKALTNGLFG